MIERFSSYGNGQSSESIQYVCTKVYKSPSRESSPPSQPREEGKVLSSPAITTDPVTLGEQVYSMHSFPFNKDRAKSRWQQPAIGSSEEQKWSHCSTTPRSFSCVLSWLHFMGRSRPASPLPRPPVIYSNGAKTP